MPKKTTEPEGLPQEAAQALINLANLINDQVRGEPLEIAAWELRGILRVEESPVVQMASVLENRKPILSRDYVQRRNLSALEERALRLSQEVCAALTLEVKERDEILKERAIEARSLAHSLHPEVLVAALDPGERDGQLQAPASADAIEHRTNGAGHSSPDTDENKTGKARLGRLTKVESEAVQACLLAALDQHPTLKEHPDELARMAKTTERTARRFLEKLEAKYLESKAANTEPAE